MRVVDVSHPLLSLVAELVQQLVVLPVVRQEVDDARSVRAWLAVHAEDFDVLNAKMSWASFAAAVLTLPEPEQISNTLNTVLRSFPASEILRRLVRANAGAQESSSSWLFMPSTNTPLPGPDLQYGELLPRPHRGFRRSGVATAVFTFGATFVLAKK